METLNIRQDLINRLVKLNKKNKFLISANTTNVNLTNLKVGIQQNLNKIKKGAKAFEILAYICMTIIAVVAFIKVFSDNGGPDLNKGALFIFLTASFTFSAFSQKLRVERLEQQIFLLNILEKMDSNKNDNTA